MRKDWEAKLRREVALKPIDEMVGSLPIALDALHVDAISKLESRCGRVVEQSPDRFG